MLQHIVFMEVKRLNPKAQIVAEIGQLKRYFPSGRVINETTDSLTWEVRLQPTELSRVYTIKLKYKVGDFPRVYVTDPFPLERYPGKDFLAHVYSTSKQELCLYMRGTGEWSRHKMIAKTVIPWAAEWLNFMSFGWQRESGTVRGFIHRLRIRRKRTKEQGGYEYEELH